MTEKELNEQVKKYEPLINKIVKQFFDKIHLPWSDLKSMGYEGFWLAVKKYDQSRSNMSFMQYAAFSIRNQILTSIDDELRTVKLSAYAQKVSKENGNALFNSVSMSVISGENNPESDECYSREYKYNLYENNNYDKTSAYELFYNTLEENFSKRDTEIFYMSYGLKNYDLLKGKDIAKYFNLSEGSISQKNKKIIEFIKSNNDLREAFAEF